MEEIQKFMDENKAWTDATFGQLTPLSVVKHLRKEVNEVIEAMNDEETFGTKGATLMEFADIYLLMLNSLAQSGITFEELHRAAVNKMKINRKRDWQKKEGGFFEHTTVHAMLPGSKVREDHHSFSKLNAALAESEEVIQAYRQDPTCKHLTKFRGKIVETKSGKVGIIRNSDTMYEGKYKVYTTACVLLCLPEGLKLLGHFD